MQNVFSTLELESLLWLATVQFESFSHSKSDVFTGASPAANA